MKTIQISDELWKRLKIDAAMRGITMREVVEELGKRNVVELAVELAATRGAMQGLQRSRDLKVEYEES